MIGLKKRDTKDLFKVIARQHGISVKEVKAEMQKPLMKQGAIQTQRCRQISRSISEINALHQKNIFISLSKRRSLEWYNRFKGDCV